MPVGIVKNNIKKIHILLQNNFEQPAAPVPPSSHWTYAAFAPTDKPRLISCFPAAKAYLKNYTRFIQTLFTIIPGISLTDASLRQHTIETIMSEAKHSPANSPRLQPTHRSASTTLHQGYDPEMLYVECGHCGAPVLWEPGKATRLLKEAGIDPLELDASCILVTSACPHCSGDGHYSVQIFRLSGTPDSLRPLSYGNA